VQVYSVYYHESGRFLIGFKLKKGYFFYDPRTGGDLVPEGQALNGGGKHALPGGSRKREKRSSRPLGANSTKKPRQKSRQSRRSRMSSR
jgi:hypothetical protein